MLTGCSSETLQSNTRPVQFRLRTLFAWTTGLAILAALIAGAFGPLLQIIAISIAALVLGWIASSLVIGGPWIALMWLLKQIVGCVKRHR